MKERKGKSGGGMKGRSGREGFVCEGRKKGNINTV